MGDSETDPTKIIVYVSTVSSNREIKDNQRRIETVLELKKIAFDKVDIAACEESKNKMRQLCGDEKALPPKIFRGDEYLGDYNDFDEAVETANLNGFLKIDS